MFVIYEESGQIRETRDPELGEVPDGLQWLETDEFAHPRTHKVVAGALVPWVAPTPPALVRRKLFSELGAVRYAQEIAGTSLADGMRILTDRDDQAMTTQALLRLERMPEGSTISFKSPSGFVELDLPALRAVWAAGSDHVQRCFAAEGVVAGQIAGLTDEALAGFDVTAAFAAAVAELSA